MNDNEMLAILVVAISVTVICITRDLLRKTKTTATTSNVVTTTTLSDSEQANMWVTLTQMKGSRLSERERIFNAINKVEMPIIMAGIDPKKFIIDEVFKEGGEFDVGELGEWKDE